MKRYFLLPAALIVLLNINGAFAQDSIKHSKSDYHLSEHLFAGGGFTLNFGSATAIGIAPIVGYKFTDRLAAGVGVNYLYLNGFDYYGSRFQTSIYGGNIFARYRVFEKVFAYGEYGFTSYVTPAIDIKNQVMVNYRISVPDLLLGGGYAQQIGRNSYFEILVLYDVLYNPGFSYGSSPLVFRPGFIFGF